MDKLREDKFDKLDTKNLDLHGRRVVNAGRSLDSTDYITKAEFDELKEEFEKLKKLVG